MSLSLLQDIHITDKNNWKDFLSYWKSGKYPKAKQLLENTEELSTKYVDAEWFNSLTDFIYGLEILPNNFTKKKIVVSYLPPDLEVGDIWFQLEMGGINVNVFTNVISTNSTSTTITYNSNDILINAIAYKNNEVITINQNIDEPNNQVTFSVNEAPDHIITCMVFSVNNINVQVDRYTPSVGSDDFTMSYNGSLLSVMYLDESGNRSMTNLTFATRPTGFRILFDLGSPISSSSTKGRIVYISSSHLSEILKTGSSSFSSTNEILLCDGYLTECFITQPTSTSGVKEVILGDISFVLQNAIIGVEQNVNTSLDCVIYYT